MFTSVDFITMGLIGICGLIGQVAWENREALREHFFSSDPQKASSEIIYHRDSRAPEYQMNEARRGYLSYLALSWIVLIASIVSLIFWLGKNWGFPFHPIVAAAGVFFSATYLILYLKLKSKKVT